MHIDNKKYVKIIIFLKQFKKELDTNNEKLKILLNYVQLNSDTICLVQL